MNVDHRIGSGMNKATLLIVVLLATTGAWAKAPKNDWQVVREDIPKGWQITVTTSFAFPCVFQRATADELVCTPISHNREPAGTSEMHIRRERVREIGAERREGANMLAGAAGGGGLGSLLGALLFAGARGPGAYAFALSGAATGARSGRSIHILPGKVIYRAKRSGVEELHQSSPGSPASGRTSP